MEEIYKEVDFEKYCKTCDYEDLAEYEEPCDECLEHPYNTYSRRPVCWKGEN